MSWLFSQALVAEYSAASYLDGEPFAQLNVMPTPHKFWRNDKTMEFSKLSQFGLTCAVLTAEHGEALLTSYRAAFPVRTLAQQEKAQASKASAVDYGKSSPALLARLCPLTSMWKIPQCSLFEDLEQSLEIWPKWGSVVIGASFQPLTVERRICESVFGSLESINGEQDAEVHKGVADLIVSAVRSDDGKATVLKWSINGFEPIYEAEVLLEGMPEPEFHEGKRSAWSASTPSKEIQKRMLRAMFLSREIAGTSQGQEYRKQLARELTDALRKLSQYIALGREEGQWKIILNGVCYQQPMLMRRTLKKEFGSVAPTPSGNWPTPTCSDVMTGNLKSSQQKENSMHSVTLPQAVMRWPTPAATDGTRGGTITDNMTGQSLTQIVNMWPTPCASEGRQGLQIRRQGKKGSQESLSTAVRTWPTPRAFMHKDSQTDRGKGNLGEVVSGQLNPTWVEWLMVWPLEWTDLKPLAMDKYQSAWLQPLICLESDSRDA